MEALIFAFRFFTNLPLPGTADWHERNAAASLAWLPLTGAVIGVFLAALATLLEGAGFPHSLLLKAVMIMALELWIGGALFLDGLADTCDGIFSGLDRSRMLMIMQDSRIGVNGALGLIFVLAAKAALLVELAPTDDFLFVLIAYPCISRWAASFAALNFDTAKEEGLAFFFKVGQKPAYFVLSSAFVMILLFFFPRFFYLAAAAMLAPLYMGCRYVQHKLGGLTGDTYGFAALVSEVSFIFFAAFFSRMA